MMIFYTQLDYNDFKELAERRIKEANILLDNGCHCGAYYLAGYSIELALKACYCKEIKAQSFPPEKEVHKKLYSHDLNSLMDVSGVKKLFEDEVKKKENLQSNWEPIKDWSEKARYSNSIKPEDAEILINAIQDDKDGVLTWIKKVW